MRFKKQKRHRKIVRFYTACFGFRQPFKVLCDGTFVHHLLANRIMPADKALFNTLGAPVKLFTTRCILTELKTLGNSHSEALEAATKLVIGRCEHEKRATAEACIREVIAEKNTEHFFVATQDAELRNKLQEIPGVPLIYGLRNALLMEQPSASQRQFVKSSEEERMHMTESEYDLLKKRVKKRVATEETNDSSDENGDLEDQNLEVKALERPYSARKGNGMKDKVQFKRNRAKGPNPLSCKKKKNRDNPNPPSKKVQKNEGAERSRGRKRKRTRKTKKPAETDGS